MTNKTIREMYLDKEILQVGTKLTEGLEVLDTRSNYVVCVDSNGEESKLFLEQAYERILKEEVRPKISFKDIPAPYLTYKNFACKNIPDSLFEDLNQIIDESTDQYATLQLLKTIDSFILTGSPVSYKMIQESLSKINKTIDLEEYVRVPSNRTQIDLPFVREYQKHIINESSHKKQTMAEFLVEAKKFADEFADMDSDKELDKLASKIKDLEDIAHHYDDEDFIDSLNEHLSREERIKKRITFSRTEAKRTRSRELALKKLSSPSKVANKAHKAAIQLIKEKLARKPLADLSLPEKDRLEDMIRTRKDIVNRLTNKLIPKIRQIEHDRVYTGNKK